MSRPKGVICSQLVFYAECPKCCAWTELPNDDYEDGDLEHPISIDVTCYACKEEFEVETEAK